jgi:hypothetical protein
MSDDAKNAGLRRWFLKGRILEAEPAKHGVEPVDDDGHMKFSKHYPEHVIKPVLVLKVQI